MTRSVLTTYFFVPLVAVTFAIAWIEIKAGSTPSPQPLQSTEPAQLTQSARTAYTPDSVVKLQSAPAAYTSDSVVKPVHHGPNHPPIVRSPVDDRSRVVLFPKGPGAVLEFEGEPATDYEEDVLTYRFGIAIPGKPGLRSPQEALLLVIRIGNRFLIRPHGTVSLERFASVYGSVGSVPVLPAVIFASDGKSESIPKFFNLSLVFDASTRDLEPSGSMKEYPEEARELSGRPEAVSDPVDVTYTGLEKVVGVSRVFRLDPPFYSAETVRTIQTAR